MGTSIGAAIDHIITVCQDGYTGLDATGRTQLTIPPLSTIAPSVEVADNYAEQSDGPWVIIGRASADEDSDLSAQAQYDVLGQQRISETYSIPGVIIVYGDGGTQKPVRDQAIALFDGVVKLIWADPTLGGVLDQGRIGILSQFTLTQSTPQQNGSTSAAGLSAEVSFQVQISNTYRP
jgi:hypothetical protein